MKLDDKTREGLKLIFKLAWADVQCAEENDFSPQQRDELGRGFMYLDGLITQEGRRRTKG